MPAGGGTECPAVCNTGRNEFKLYRAMVGTPNSRWVKWLDTSEVEELILPRSVTDEDMLIMFDAAVGLSFVLLSWRDSSSLPSRGNHEEHRTTCESHESTIGDAI